MRHRRPVIRRQRDLVLVPRDAALHRLYAQQIGGDRHGIAIRELLVDRRISWLSPCEGASNIYGDLIRLLGRIVGETKPDNVR
jgi:hypothetical protein